MSNERPAIRRPAWLPRALGGALGQLVCGLALIWPIVIIQKSLADSQPVLKNMSLILMDSGILLAGIGAGFAVALYLRRSVWPVLLWVASISGLALVAWISSAHPVNMLITGFFAGAALSLGEYVVRSTAPNLKRILVIGLLNYSLAAFGLLWVLVVLAENKTTATGISAVIASSALIILLVFQSARWSMFQKLALLESSCGSKLVAAANSNPTPPTHHDHDHDHDHDSRQGVEEGCGEDECCGGVMESIGAPRWTGVLISASGWLMLLGPVVCSLLLIANSESWRMTKLLAISCAILMGIRIVRVGAAQFGNTIILAPLLVLMAISSVPAIFAFQESWWQIAVLAVWAGTSTAVFQASRNLATEYFPDSGRQRGRILVPSMGPVLAGSILLVVSLIPESMLWYCLTAGIPALAFAICLSGLRAIPQPLISTGFATRLSRNVNQEQPC